MGSASVNQFLVAAAAALCLPTSSLASGWTTTGFESPQDVRKGDAIQIVNTNSSNITVPYVLQIHVIDKVTGSPDNTPPWTTKYSSIKNMDTVHVFSSTVTVGAKYEMTLWLEYKYETGSEKWSKTTVQDDLSITIHRQRDRDTPVSKPDLQYDLNKLSEEGDE